MIGRRTAKGKTLVYVVAEFAVVIDIDRGGIILVSAYKDGIFSEKETPTVVGTPVDIHYIGAVEHVFLVEAFLAQRMTDTVIDGRGDVAENMHIEIVAADLTAVLPFFSLLVEGGPHIEEQFVDLVLRKSAKACECQIKENDQFFHLA